MNDNNPIITRKAPRGTLKGSYCVKITKEQENKLRILEEHPHYVNIPNYIRDCIDRLYNVRTTKELENKNKPTK